MDVNEETTGTDVQNGQVRDRLLDAAEKLFCQKGFDGTSVRDLTRAARCNIAAVNYHFGGKDKLYVQMFHRQIRRMMDRQREVVGRITRAPAATLEDLLRGSVSEALKHLQGDDPSGAVMKLMVREMLNRHVDKTDVLGELEEEFYTLFAKAFMRFCPNLSLRQAQLLFFSLDALVVHPLLFYEFYQDVVPDLQVNEMVEHIVQVAAAGIHAYAEGGAR